METAAEWKEEGDEAWATTLDQQALANDVALKVPNFREKTSWAAKDTPEFEKRVLITWCFVTGGSDEEKAMVKTIEVFGGEQTIGPAPRGVLERTLEKHIRQK